MGSYLKVHFVRGIKNVRCDLCINNQAYILRKNDKKFVRLCLICMKRVFEKIKKYNQSKYEVMNNCEKYKKMRLNEENLQLLVKLKKITLEDISKILKSE